MQTITVPTSMNIDLEFAVAGAGDRILATLIDLAVQATYVFLVVQLFYWLELDGSDATIWVLLLPAMGYHLGSELWLDGQSLGKRALKTKVVRLDGNPPGLSAYLLRWMLRPIDILLATGLVAIIAVAVTAKAQRLGDLVAGTTVIKLKPEARFNDTIFMETGDAYAVQFPQVRKLSDRDVSIMKDILDNANRNRNAQLLSRLASRIREVTGIRQEIDDLLFLQIVLKDYNHLFGK